MHSRQRLRAGEVPEEGKISRTKPPKGKWVPDIKRREPKELADSSAREAAGVKALAMPNVIEIHICKSPKRAAAKE